MKNKTTILSIFLIIILLSTITSCKTTSSPPPTTAPTTTPTIETPLPTVAGIDASLVYTSYCASCHGASRQGGVGPALTQGMSIAFLSAWLPVHRTGVTLDPRLRDALIDWLYLNSTPATQPQPTDPALMFALNCSVCHGANRDGGNGGPSIKPGDLTNLDALFISTFLAGHFSGMGLSQDRRDTLAGWLLSTP